MDLILFFRFSSVSKLAHCSPGLFKLSTATGVKIHLYSDHQISKSIDLVTRTSKRFYCSTFYSNEMTASVQSAIFNM